MKNLIKAQCEENDALTLTENGALTFATTGDKCLDLLFCGGAMRHANPDRINEKFSSAYEEDRLAATKLLFHIRDARGGMGERKFFRYALNWLADKDPNTVRKNLHLIAEYGRYDDLLALFDTSLEADVIDMIKKQLQADLKADPKDVSLLGKWLPSVNATSKKTRKQALKLIRGMKMHPDQYRKALSNLRAKIRIIENNLREKDYTFDYSTVPSQASLKYKAAFARNDTERYEKYLQDVADGKAKINAKVLAPYEIVRRCNSRNEIDKKALDAMWKSLPYYDTGENTLAVVDGSGSMYSNYGPVSPILVAVSLGIYHAEHNSGPFENAFITFSENPRLVELEGDNIVDKVVHCMSYNEVANTDLAAVFDLILDVAVKNRVPQDELPSKIVILSDMEFDECARNADETVFRAMKRRFESMGYKLPTVVFWNIQSRHDNFPIRHDEDGAALASGFNPALFSFMTGEISDPMELLNKILNSDRYAAVTVA